MLMHTQYMNINDVSIRLAASKQAGESRVKQLGLNKATSWCSARAGYHEIKRLATFREYLGKIGQAIVDEETGYIRVADRAVAASGYFNWREAYRFWHFVGATRDEVHSLAFLDAFLEGCELFWEETAKDI